ncbi:EamA family transporter [Halomonas elongata]|uniref:DMT superfamily transport protein n=1 Tax=Halomonas elongata (strain ATCC 33173 / DSM 2581 / NBRC 15536 / NCIMB 2198 / 1H9) TaxID=768066 RepID=E1V6I6_HALED|nr:EamA family transporter [Halomonas elongata]WBF18548.1 EamA family transporter [Halomonas elongata]WPU47402.1 EamA family transporter [Halomonas elongata DSM 2581]CBV41315.1 DMT superfamily transport protein [Halomonas elongata DSM 2581]
MANVPTGHKADVVKALGCLLLVGTLLALSLSVAKFADAADLPRLSFLMVAMAGASLAQLLLSLPKRAHWRLDRRVLEYALVSGILLALPNALGFLAVRHVGAGFVSLNFAFPILVTWLLAVLLRMESLRWDRLGGVLLGLAGGVVLALSKASAGGGHLGWSLLILLLPLTLALGNIYRTWRWPDGVPLAFLTALVLAGAALGLLPVAFGTETGRVGELFASPAAVGLLLVEIGIFTVLYLFFFILQRLAGPVYLSQIGTVAAVMGTAIAVLFLGESAPPNLAIAGGLVIAGTLVFQRAAWRAAQASSPSTVSRAKES